MNTITVMAVSAVTALLFEITGIPGFLRTKTTRRRTQRRGAPRHAGPRYNTAPYIPITVERVPAAVDPYEPEQRAFTEIIFDQLTEEGPDHASATA